MKDASTTINKIHNPFLIYGYSSPEYFCDREEETKQLVSALHNGRNITLMSPRRFGKTGLIHHSFNKIEGLYPNAECFYLDIYATHSLTEFAKLFGETVLGKLDSTSQKVVAKVRDLFSHCKISYTSEKLLGGSISLEFRQEDTEITLKSIFSYLASTDKEIFIAIDEFQEIAEYEEKNVEALLRTYVQMFPEIHFIFSGSRNHMMSSMFDTPKRPFFRSTEKMHIHEIDEDKYYEFACRHMEKTMTILPRNIFHEVYSRFAGHTWYIQYILNKLYEASPSVVDEDDVRSCLVSIIQTNNDDFARQYRSLTHNQQQLLKAIAKEGHIKSINGIEFIRKHSLKGTSSINVALKFLCDNELVYQYENGYQVYDRFFALWLKEL